MSRSAWRIATNLLRSSGEMMILVETLMVLALLAVLQIALASVQQTGQQQQQKTPAKPLETTGKFNLIDICATIEWEGFIVTLVEFLWLVLRVAALLPALLTLELSALVCAAHRLIGCGLQKFGLISNTWLLTAYKQMAGDQRTTAKKHRARRSAALS